MKRIILKNPLKSMDGIEVGWYGLPYIELLPIAEKAELKADNIPIANENIRPIPHNTTAKTLPRYTEKFGTTSDLSLHPKYPTNIAPKNTENTIVNNRYVIKSIDPLAMNDDQKTDPTNRNIPKITNENTITGKLVFSFKFSKKDLFSISKFGLMPFFKSYPQSGQNSSSLSNSNPQLGQCFTISI